MLLVFQHLLNFYGTYYFVVICLFSYFILYRKAVRTKIPVISIDASSRCQLLLYLIGVTNVFVLAVSTVEHL